MSRSTKCFKCKAKFSWSSEIWNIGLVPGYKSKIHKCICGHEQSMHEPVSKVEISAWNGIKKMLWGE